MHESQGTRYLDRRPASESGLRLGWGARRLVAYIAITRPDFQGSTAARWHLHLPHSQRVHQVVVQTAEANAGWAQRAGLLRVLSLTHPPDNCQRDQSDSGRAEGFRRSWPVGLW